MKEYLLRFAVVIISCFSATNGIDAQVIRNIPNQPEYIPTDIAIDTLSEKDGLFFTDLTFFPYAAYYMTDVLQVPYYAEKNDWWYPEEPYYRDSIIYWDTSVIACFETSDFEQKHGDFYQVPSHIEKYGKKFDVRYYFFNIVFGQDGNFDLWHSAKYIENKTRRPFRKYEIPNSVEHTFRFDWRYAPKPWVRGEYLSSCNGDYKYLYYYGMGFLPYSCDTIMVGTSLKNLLPSAFSSCKYLYLNAGIHPARVRLNEYIDNKRDVYRVNLRDLYYVSDVDLYRARYYEAYVAPCNKGTVKKYKQGQVHFDWKEVHVPKGYREYYQTGIDSLDNLIIDDLPVVQCTDIQLLRKRYVPGVNDKHYFIHYYLDNVSGETIILEEQDTLYIQVLCEPMDATVRYFAKLSSSDESVATIDSSGMIRTHSEGRAVITAEALDGSGVTSRLTIDVVPYTGISHPSDNSASYPQAIYSIDGIRQSLPPNQLKRGLYIINGKKVLIK